MLPPKLSECTYSFLVPFTSRGNHRLAKEKFGEVADEFMTYVLRQMGAKVFMLVAFKGEEGQDIVSKSGVPLSQDYAAANNVHRVETRVPRGGPPGFMPIFNKHGGETWEHWGTFASQGFFSSNQITQH